MAKEAKKASLAILWGGEKQYICRNCNSNSIILMRNNYITPTCEEIEINLDSTVLQSSVLPSGFEDGGEIW